MPATQPDEEPIIVEFDLPVPAYLEMLSAVKELGFPTLEAYLYHLVEQLIADDELQADDAGPSLAAAWCLLRQSVLSTQILESQQGSHTDIFPVSASRNRIDDRNVNVWATCPSC